MKMKIQGIIVPTITPFNSKGEIDFDAAGEHIDFLIKKGVAGIFSCGSTGEGPLLTIEEKKELTEVSVKAAQGRIPVIIHTGEITTSRALDLTYQARKVGAQAAALIPPYY